MNTIRCPYCGEVWTEDAPKGAYEGIADCKDGGDPDLGNCGRSFYIIPWRDGYATLKKENYEPIRNA